MYGATQYTPPDTRTDPLSIHRSGIREPLCLTLLLPQTLGRCRAPYTPTDAAQIHDAAR
jgi:hypothetical protein